MLVAYNLIQLAVNKKTGTLYLLHIHIIPEPLFNEHWEELAEEVLDEGLEGGVGGDED